MSEEEWLTAAEPTEALKWIRDAVGERKARLFMVACCRSIEGFLWIDDHCVRSVTIAERIADGFGTSATLAEANLVMSVEVADHYHRHPVREACFYCTCSEAAEVADKCAYYAAHSAYLTRNWADPDDHSEHVQRCIANASGTQVRLLRCIFGSPFRSVSFDPAWRTSDVVALARGIYEGRAFDRMPILADALQDAGCNNDDILNHCRDTGTPHARGCWVVDLVLGKA